MTKTYKIASRHTLRDMALIVIKGMAIWPRQLYDNVSSDIQKYIIMGNLPSPMKQIFHIPKGCM